MYYRKALISFVLAGFIFASCGGENQAENRATSTPIDSTTLNGTEPAVYGGDNPANDQDTNYANSSDTGTHESKGPDNMEPK